MAVGPLRPFRCDDHPSSHHRVSSKSLTVVHPLVRKRGNLVGCCARNELNFFFFFFFFFFFGPRLGRSERTRRFSSGKARGWSGARISPPSPAKCHDGGPGGAAGPLRVCREASSGWLFRRRRRSAGRSAFSEGREIAGVALQVEYVDPGVEQIRHERLRPAARVKEDRNAGLPVDGDHARQWRQDQTPPKRRPQGGLGFCPA